MIPHNVWYRDVYVLLDDFYDFCKWENDIIDNDFLIS